VSDTTDLLILITLSALDTNMDQKSIPNGASTTITLRHAAESEELARMLKQQLVAKTEQLDDAKEWGDTNEINRLAREVGLLEDVVEQGDAMTETWRSTR
jgi:hypothetical protein